MKNIILISFIGSLIGGCMFPSMDLIEAQQENLWKNYSAGETGCLPEDIRVVKKAIYGSTSTWVASCHGVDYVCNSRSGENGTAVSCKKSVK